jgi:hypothetical protein
VATSNDEGRRQAVPYGDQRAERGHGGETHQIATGSDPRLTTQQGAVVSDDQNTLRAGERGRGRAGPRRLDQHDEGARYPDPRL